MLCTQCGTELGEGKNFCRKCGARLARGGEPGGAPWDPEGASAVSKAPSDGATVIIERTQALPISVSREDPGINKIAVAVGIIGVVVVAGLGLYFGTELFRSGTEKTIAPQARQQLPQMAASPAGRFADPPKTDIAGIETPAADSGFNSPLGTNAAEPRRSAAMDFAPTAAKEPGSKTAPKPDTPAVARKRQPQSAPSAAGAQERDSALPTPSRAARPGASPGVYQTIRPTRVHESPSLSSKVVARIEDGVRVNVVGSTGEWLEVRSRTGNPPGFIRRDDAVLLE